MPDPSECLLSLNRDIQQAVAVGDFQKAHDLDLKRYAFIAALPPTEAQNDTLRIALHDTLTELRALTQKLQIQLQDISRQRRAAVTAHRSYRRSINSQKTGV